MEDLVELQPYLFDVLDNELPFLGRSAAVPPPIDAHLLRAVNGYFSLLIRGYRVTIRCPRNLQCLFYRNLGIRASERINTVLKDAYLEWLDSHDIRGAVIFAEKADNVAVQNEEALLGDPSRLDTTGRRNGGRGRRPGVDAASGPVEDPATDRGRLPGSKGGRSGASDTKRKRSTGKGKGETNKGRRGRGTKAPKPRDNPGKGTGESK